MSKIYTFTPEQLKTYTEMCKGNTDQYVDIEKLTQHIIYTTEDGVTKYFNSDDYEVGDNAWWWYINRATEFPTLEAALQYKVTHENPIGFDQLYPKGF